ncbi:MULTISPECIES: DEAD/DEAH box helicase family protein [unclassified Rathayibacter]|uniref:DEAD/DEAH box helicase family protein n=1 Tax=unclassified Rathayibacter TaxID=2609250 RepID=UPI000CE88FEB|nr:MULTISPECIES: DEAD/DEAH box helicase family protein [unclassified Rathayibacter]PPF28507.1 restriction endonuclease subunit R [Rathayibacter sp. AY1F2]PPH48457.1 restriction endonuclease subunit R [Rathayibacter sp. AY1F7]
MNFDFVRAAWPDVCADASRAESYLSSDPRSACFYSRRAIEQLVSHLFEVLDLPVPYQDDLAARINDASFARVAGVGIGQKLNLIRKLGNLAVHAPQPVRPDIALAALRELHHVLVWAVFRHSAHPEGVPTGASFDSALAARAAPLTREDVQRLAAKFAAQDEAHAKALANRDELAAVQAAEIEQLRAQVAAAQASNNTTDNHDYSEAETRDLFIDVLLAEAGWPLTEARDREYEVAGMPNGQGVGFVDYVLWGSDGLPLGVVEAKRTTKSAQVGQQQAKLYADRLEAAYGRRPVVFFTNGYEHWLWDDAAGYPPRQVAGFFTRSELELMMQRRSTRSALSGAAVSPGIAGRHYQVRAIRAVGDAFDRKQRQALLVMATGSGKTRTVIALADQLMKANWAKRILFLADRTALVNQAANAFKAHLPGAATVNLVTERNAEGRVYVSTYPTMMNLIDHMSDGEGAPTRRFGPGFFDLIVIDEAHRSIYQKYGAIFDWFDALLVGLTATPKNEVDHNTYRRFHLEDGVPTDSYGLDEAVAEGFLVPPRGVSVGTRFLRQGIRYDDLSDEEKDDWDALDWGDGGPPTAVDAEEVNRFLFNEDTVDKVLATLMTRGYKVAGGDRLGKTIVFAKNQAHAEFIQRRFDEQYPEQAGHFARVITHGTPYAQNLIDEFSIADRAPHIAISVDMLDTGIDVPEIVNLVFFKTVRSMSKFWQMIGRGTRLRPDLFGEGLPKQDFLVFDFCGNLEFFSQDLPGSEGSTQKSLSQRLFEARLGLLTALDREHLEGELRATTADTLHRVIAGMNIDNILVRPERRWVEQFAASDAWVALTPEEAAEVLAHLAGLPSGVKDDDVDAKRFDLLILRRQLAQLDGDAAAAERIRQQVQSIATALLGKSAIPAVASQLVLLEEVAGDDWWIDVTVGMLETARIRIRELAGFVPNVTRPRVYTDFIDELGDATEIFLAQTTPGTDLERFRAKAAAYLRQHEDHLALQRLRRNRQLTPDDLAALESMLLASGAGSKADIVLAAEQAHGLGPFIRSLVGLDREAALESFARFLDGSRFSVDQIRFIHLIADELTANGLMSAGRLYESPYTDRAPSGIDYLFEESDVTAIVDILHKVDARARVEVVA